MPDNVPLAMRNDVPAISVQGEEFNYERKHGLVYLSHPKWSLTGVGETLARAILDIRYSAAVLWREFMSNHSPTDFTREALKMRGYCYQVMMPDYVDENGDCQCFMCRNERGEVNA